MWPFGRRAENDAIAAGAMLRFDQRLLNASPENPSTNLADPASWLSDWAHGGVPTAFGPHVSERTAMCASAVYRSVALISGAVAGLSLKIYKRTPNGREEARGHRLWPMFQVTPFPGRAMTSFTWRELWMVNQLLWGNHVSIIRYDGAARIVGFEPVMPWDVEVYRLNHRNLYRCVLWDSSFGPVAEGVTQRVEWHDQEDVIHIPGLGFNGVSGLSRIRSFARNAVSLAVLLEEQVGRVHENAAKPSGYVTVPPKMSKDGFDRFKAMFNEQNAGRQNAGKLIFGDKDTTYTAMQMSPEDLNTIEFRGYQVADISRFFGVPLHLLNQVDKATSWGTGISEQTLAFLIYTLDPDLGRIEAELNYKLFYGSEYYAEFDRDSLMAMDPLKAAQVAQTEISTGVLLINERRRHKNRPPVENGDQPIINSTNVPLAKIFAPGAQPVADPITPGAEQAPVEPEPDAPEPGAPNEPQEDN
jgi:HK97 family phage portal protein